MRGGCTSTAKGFFLCLDFLTPCIVTMERNLQAKKMKDFCKTNSITNVHGASRTPTTQGLVELKLNSWCGVLGEAAYKKNITIHAATKQIPYVAVFGTKPWKETNNNGLSTEDNDETTIVTPSHHPRKGS